MTNPVVYADWAAPASIVAGTTTRSGDERDLPAPPRLLQQVHGTRVIQAEDGLFAQGEPEADAIVASTPGSICTVRTADCLPILLCSKEGGEIAAAHAGWRGLAAGIAEAVVGTMQTPPEDLLVWLGPAISQPAFEVGEEVREAFVKQDQNAGAAFTRNQRGRWQADLVTLAKQRLQAAGVQSITGGEYCTFGDASRFYSFRRDGATGRLLSFVYRRAE